MAVWTYICPLLIYSCCFNPSLVFEVSPSGRKYYKKAIKLDPQCGDAYMYLGLIALRRYQKRNGCRLLEQAVHLDASNKKKIEHMLKSIY